jgi:glucose/arabinose dehydrogenase
VIRHVVSLCTTTVFAIALSLGSAPQQARAAGPSMLHPLLGVRPVATGLVAPTSIAFLAANDLLALEKFSGRVLRVTNGAVTGVALDLAVNGASERGLLGIALHPRFPATAFVYLYWTESASGMDSVALADVPLLGNRVDRFVWNGSTLSHDRNLIKLRAFQADEGQPLRGNHDGGVIRFGPDGKIYVIVGDVGRDPPAQ